MKELYELPLHKDLKIDSSTYVFKVPGGWIYHFFENVDTSNAIGGVELQIRTSVFVPYPENA